MAAATITITDTTKGPFNLLNVLRGTQTLGVSLPQTYPGLSPNCQRRRLQADYNNGGTKIIIGADGSVSATNGIPIVAGDQFPDESDQEDISLSGLWFTASANGGILNVNVE